MQLRVGDSVMIQHKSKKLFNHFLALRGVKICMYFRVKEMKTDQTS